jgi:hypothetical protein
MKEHVDPDDWRALAARRAERITELTVENETLRRRIAELSRVGVNATSVSVQVHRIRTSLFRALRRSALGRRALDLVRTTRRAS